MVKAREKYGKNYGPTTGPTVDWVNELEKNENSQVLEIEDNTNTTSSIQNFIAQKIEQTENVEPEKKESIISEKFEDKLAKLEDEGFNVYYDLDSFNGSDTYQSKRYVGAIFNKVDSNMEVLAIVTLEYDPENKSKEELKEDFENFKNSLKNDNNENNISVRFSIQNLNDLTLDKNIELIKLLKQKAIEEDPELHQAADEKKKQADQSAKDIEADEKSGYQHEVHDEKNEEENSFVAKTPSKRKPK